MVTMKPVLKNSKQAIITRKKIKVKFPTYHFESNASPSCDVSIYSYKSKSSYKQDIHVGMCALSCDILNTLDF